MLFHWMDAERIKRIEEIYHAALEIPPAGRESFFKEHCGADESLRREVESLLAFENTSLKFIDHSPESLAAEMFSAQEKQASFIDREIGRYKIKKLLGEGGMGKVFLAEDTELERLVALKILPADFSEREDRVRRFVREAKAISALNHPNILTIYEIGNTGDMRFIATEYIEGETLRERQKREKTDLREILDIAAQVAAALGAAHSAGIIHRDIKPENIMLRRDGFVKVLDFGLAKLTESPATGNGSDALESPTRKLDLTNPGAFMGTTSYMSPEQIRGRANIDGRTDIWSLGVVIFEMMTGRVPFTGETMGDVIASILKTEAPNLSKSVSGCPAELDRIVNKCLQKKRDERYQVVKDLALDLKSLKRDLEFSAEFDRVTDGAERNLTAEVPQPVPTTVKSGKRFSLTAALLILLSAALFFGGVWWFFGGFVKTAETPEVASVKTAEIVNWAASPGEIYSTGTFSPDGKKIAFTSTRGGTKNIWIKQTAAGEAIQITKDEFRNESPIWSPDGERLAFFSVRGKQFSIWQMPIFGGSPKLIAEIEDGGAQLKFWSKQDLIYYESGNNLFAIDANSGQTRQITDFAGNTAARSISLSPDEKQIAYATVEGKTLNLWTKNLTAGEPKKLFGAETEIKNTVWHPDNQRIFYSSPVDGTFQIFVTDIHAAPPKQITSAERDSLVLDVSSDGEKILFGSAKEESDIWGVNLKEGKEFIVASDINSELWAAIAPEGKLIAYQSIKNLSQGNKLNSGAILTKRLDTDEPPTELVANGSLPVFSPDGQQIAFMQLSGNQYHIETIRAAGGGQKRLTGDGAASVYFSVLPYNLMQTSYISWSPDGSKIAYISNRSGQSNIWLANADGSNDAQLTDNSDPELYFYCPLWSSDGKRIAFTSKTGAGKPTYSVWVIDVETKISRTVTQQQTFYRLISWLPAGNELIMASITGSEVTDLLADVSLFQVEIESGKTREIAVLKEAYPSNIQMSPDKKSFAFAARREGKDDLWLIPAAGGAEKRLTNNNDSRLYFSSLAWSPDGSAIFFGKQSRYSLLSMLTNFK